MSGQSPRRQLLRAGIATVVAGAISSFGKPNQVFAAPAPQLQWRFCNKCHAMFYNGYPNKGLCAGGGAHVAQGYNFALPHDVPGTPNAQTDWRFCNKCQVMFYDGYPHKGQCPGGGGHVAQGYNFVLRFRGNLEDDVQLNPVRE